MAAPKLPQVQLLDGVVVEVEIGERNPAADVMVNVEGIVGRDAKLAAAAAAAAVAIDYVA